MPLSSGLLVGVLTVVVGTILFVAKRQKKAAVLVVGVGAAMALVTLAILVLAVNSRM